MKLMSYERMQLAHYVTADTIQRAAILKEALADPKTSGPLIQALRAVEAVL